MVSALGRWVWKPQGKEQTGRAGRRAKSSPSEDWVRHVLGMEGRRVWLGVINHGESCLRWDDRVKSLKLARIATKMYALEWQSRTAVPKAEQCPLPLRLQQMPWEAHSRPSWKGEQRRLDGVMGQLENDDSLRWPLHGKSGYLRWKIKTFLITTFKLTCLLHPTRKTMGGCASLKLSELEAAVGVGSWGSVWNHQERGPLWEACSILCIPALRALRTGIHPLLQCPVAN